MWTTLRTLTNQAAEAGAPTNWVRVPPTDRFGPGKAEIRFGTLTLSGTPTSVTLEIWRRLPGDATGKIDRLKSVTIATADIAQQFPVIVEAYGGDLALKVASFAGGTTPNVSGTIEARALDPRHYPKGEYLT